MYMEKIEMKKSFTSIAIIFALMLALSSCDFLNLLPGGNGGENNGNSDKTEHTHAFGEWTTVTEPTCTEQGEKERACECGEKETESIDMIPHAFGEWTTTTEPTCTEQGEKERVCECGEREAETINASHNINFTDGICSGCGVKFSVGLEFTSNGDGTCGVSGIGTCADTDLMIPPVSPSGDRVTSIAYLAFNGCTSLTSAVIPDSVTYIGDGMFQDCTSLTSVVIPDGITYLSNYGFKNCTSLKEIVIPKGIDCIGAEAFRGCTSLTRVEISDSVTLIGVHAFQDCTALTSVQIPDSVTTIDNMAFYDCASLKQIAIPDSVTRIGDHAFDHCASLTSMVIPAGVTNIGICLFSCCTSLSSVQIPDSVTNIDNRAFYNCTSLANVCYTGTEEEWAAITIGNSNDALTGANIRYNYVKCPEYPLELLDGSGSVSVSDFIGKKVVVNFWGTWCGPCKAELPDFDKIASEFSDEVVIIAVHSVSDIDNASDYVSSNFPDSKIVFAKDTPLNTFTDLYFRMLGGTSFYPHTVILDEFGGIIYMQDGKMSYDELKEHLGLNTVKI